MPVKFSDFEDALMFLSGSMYDAEAWLSRSTGKIYIISELIDDEDQELPEDLYESDDYLILPTKRDLDLGTNLVFDFARDCMPEQYKKIQNIFRSSGAYRRFKDFLESSDKVQDWYDYENNATTQAIIQWCESQGIELDVPK